MRRLLRAVRLSTGLAAGLAAAGCGAPDPEPAPGDSAAAATTAASAGAERPAEPKGPTRRSDEEIARSIARERLRSAWAAVRDRGQLLERRGQRATLHGRLGERIGGTHDQRWLVDDTEGDGSLAIPVELPRAVERGLTVGQRVLVSGAWGVQGDEPAWVWRADEIVVATDAAPREFARRPGLQIEAVLADEVPESARGPGQPGPAGYVIATVVGRPVRFGDGWPVADVAGAEPVAYLRLPGERPVYGGDELLTDGEQWALRVGERYLVDSERIREPRRDALPLVWATAPPRRVVARAE